MVKRVQVKVGQVISKEAAGDGMMAEWRAIGPKSVEDSTWLIVESGWRKIIDGGWTPGRTMQVVHVGSDRLSIMASPAAVARADLREVESIQPRVEQANIKIRQMGRGVER